MLIRDDRGLTLVEVLVAALLTAVLSMAILQVITSTERGLRSSMAQAVATTQTVRLAQYVSYDFAGAQDVYVFAATPPTTGAHLCGSVPSQGFWTNPANPNFVRSLFSLRIPTANVPAGSTPLTQYLQPTVQTVVYSIRRAGDEFALEREVCGDAAAAQRIVGFGPSIPDAIAGQTVVQCFTANGSQFIPPADVSTMSLAVSDASRCRSFTLDLPAGDDLNQAQRVIRDLALQHLGSEVTPA